MGTSTKKKKIIKREGMSRFFTATQWYVLFHCSCMLHDSWHLVSISLYIVTTCFFLSSHYYHDKLDSSSGTFFLAHAVTFVASQPTVQ